MANLHVIIGEDDFLTEQTARKFVGDGTGLETFDSINSTNAELQLADIARVRESVATPPFFDPVKVTWWKNVNFLPTGGGKKGPSEEVAAALLKFADFLAASDLPDNQTFVLTGSSLGKNTELAKKLAAACEVVRFESTTPWQAQRAAVVRAIDDAQELGFAFAPGAAESFVGKVGTDARSMRRELEKLRAYLGEAATSATSADVAEISSTGVGVEPQIWDLTDAIGRRDLSKALAELARYEAENGFAVFMTTVIERFFRQLYEFASGRQEGVTPGNLRKFPGFLSNWSARDLRGARARFLDLREKAVSGLECVDQLVPITLVRVMRRPAGRSAR